MKELAIIYVVIWLALFVMFQGFKSCVKECLSESIPQCQCDHCLKGENK